MHDGDIGKLGENGLSGVKFCDTEPWKTESKKSAGARQRSPLTARIRPLILVLSVSGPELCF